MTITRYPGFIPKLLDAQTHATELDGTADRGLYDLGGACYLHDIYCKATGAIAFTASFIVGGDEFPLGNVTTAADRIAVNRLIPEGAQLKIVSAAGTDPKVRPLVTRLREATYNPSA